MTEDESKKIFNHFVKMAVLQQECIILLKSISSKLELESLYAHQIAVEGVTTKLEKLFDIPEEDNG